MFTGIIEEAGSVVSTPAGKLVIAASRVLEGIQPGGSIAVNGICLTVTDFTDKSFSVDIMPETLRRTNLGLLHSGDRVNLERPLGLGGEIGGHLVQGHIDDTGRVASITGEGEAVLMRFEASPEVMRYIVPRGFIAVDGTSLTVVDKDATSFSVSIVGYTRQNTILADKKVSDAVNLEVDIIGKYVAEFVKPQTTGITAEFLQEHGFTVN
ncbi:MAG: riboflavin synthase [Dehalococcoidales bacterium]|nr:riboflavin synthase [Dehalococcoidales bacterium]